MATQTKRPRGRETRQALIQAGVEEINRHGVTEFSVRRIAQICGVSCGAPINTSGTGGSSLLRSLNTSTTSGGPSRPKS